ncbi:MAG: TIGR01459 family HAD-type hydrolase [Rhodospirillaceae bacterium]|nr:TIGR01459 family HAD-type hydrolase [Rhodospirillaceae bacterium]|tara:strand:- start:747 stop:1673 length:927 start_codon:yes stop_codon:yes gene_type:complete
MAKWFAFTIAIPASGLSMNTKFIEGIASLAKAYEVFILDIWGVLMDGLDPYPGAAYCLENLRNCGKKIILLSNAPRQAHLVGEKLNSIGIPPTLYDDVLSSGEATRLALSARSDPHIAKLGNTYFYIGPDRDRGLLEGLDYTESSNLKTSNFLLVTGPWESTDHPEMYNKLFDQALEQKLLMICTNPDQVVVRQTGEQLLCAGALADHYKNLGGQILYFGKPHQDIYSILFERLGNLPKHSIVAIGDTLETDIKGANEFGIATTLVVGGVTATKFGISEGDMPIPKAFRTHCGEAGIIPTYAVPLFIW